MIQSNNFGSNRPPASSQNNFGRASYLNRPSVLFKGLRQGTILNRIAENSPTKIDSEEKTNLFSDMAEAKLIRVCNELVKQNNLQQEQSQAIQGLL